MRVTETILEAIIMHQPEIDRNGKVNIVIKVAFVIDEIPVTLLAPQSGAHIIYPTPLIAFDHLSP